MSAATAMMPDSTQTVDKMPGTKRRKSSDRKKSKRPKKDSSKTKRKDGRFAGSGSDDDSDLDLNKILEPIGAYVKDREEMIDQMFRSIAGAKLKAMLPDILKDISVEELKKLCLEQVEVMSKKRILRILDGADPETISSSGTEEESSDEEMKKTEQEEPHSQVADSTSQHSCEQRPELDPEMVEEGEYYADGSDRSSAIQSPAQSPYQSPTQDESDIENPMEEDEIADIIEKEAVNQSEEEVADHSEEDVANQSEDDACDHSNAKGPQNETEADLTEEVPVAVVSEENIADDDDVSEEGEIKEEEPNEIHDEADKNFNKSNDDEIDKVKEKREQVNIDKKETEQSSMEQKETTDIVKPKQTVKRKLQRKNSDDKSITKDNTQKPPLSKNQMEILELEMRARAIKAMLKAHTLKSPSKTGK